MSESKTHFLVIEVVLVWFVTQWAFENLSPTDAWLTTAAFLGIPLWLMMLEEWKGILALAVPIVALVAGVKLGDPYTTPISICGIVYMLAWVFIYSRLHPEEVEIALKLKERKP